VTSVVCVGDFDRSDYKNWLGTAKNVTWYVSGGANFIRPRTALNGGRPHSGTYALSTYGANDAPTHTPNVEGTWSNPEALCGMAWGPFFRVNDDTKSITVYINGGQNALDLDSMTAGGTGVALWDVDAARILTNTFVSGANSWQYSTATIPLTGLRGKTVGVVVIDHNKTGTRWCTASGQDVGWIYVDLRSTKRINRVRLRWERWRMDKYKIQVSDDATNWTDIYSTTTGDGGIDDLRGLSGSGRYVKVLSTRNNGGSLWELEVYGSTKTNLARGKPVTVSSMWNDTMAGRYAVDGIPGWGFTGVDTIVAPGAITPSPNVHHRVVRAWEFDIGDRDMAEWTGDTGSFRNGRDAAVHHYINLRARPRPTPSGQLDLDKAGEPGWLRSVHETKGTIRTSPFTIDGDIIEFYIGGSGDGGLHFDLVRASDNRVLFSKHADASQRSSMAHAFWSVKRHTGVKAYLRVVDDNTKGSILLDAIRMVDFDYTGAVRTTGPTTKAVYTKDKGEYVEVPNPIVADKNGMFRFFIANGDYDLHVTGPSVEYTLADVTIVNPFSPHTIQSSSRPPLTLVERAQKTSKGNTALLLNRPGSRDANNCPAPYRIIVNKGKCGWALTYNVDWNEINSTWTRRDLTQRTSFFRINGKTHALEYGNDYRTLGAAPVMETLFRLSADGDFWVKSHESDRGVSMIVRNNVWVDGKKVALHPGNVVVLDPANPFSVIAPRKHADLNPVVVREMDSDDPSLVQVVIAGSTPVNTIYARRDVGTLVNVGDELVTEKAGSFRAMAGKKGVDPRAILGRLHNDGFYITVP